MANEPAVYSIKREMIEAVSNENTIVRYRLFVILLILFLFANGIPGHACTTFIAGDSEHQVFGRNYDWHFGDAYVMVNKKGVNKKSYPVRTEEGKGRPAEWTARFGSVTFNQYGREFPQGGMNEAGLVVESMSLRITKNPDSDSRPYVRTENLWRQYILDTCATVREVIDTDSTIRISYDASKGIGTHCLVLDRKGEAAVIEFLDGKMVVYTGDSLPVKVLANDTYKMALSYWEKKRTPLIDSYDSIRRFVTAADLSTNYHPNESGSKPKNAFAILAAVKTSQTRWSIVYDNINMKVWFMTDANPKIRSIDVKKFDFSCNEPVKALDVNSGSEGDVSADFVDYTSAMNINFTANSYAKLASGTKIKIPPTIVEFLGRYPDQFSCRE